MPKTYELLDLNFNGKETVTLLSNMSCYIDVTDARAKLEDNKRKYYFLRRRKLCALRCSDFD